MQQLLRRMLCRVLGHNLQTVRVFSARTRKVACRRCPGVWGMNDDVQSFIEWNDDLEMAYEWKGRD